MSDYKRILASLLLVLNGKCYEKLIECSNRTCSILRLILGVNAQASNAALTLALNEHNKYRRDHCSTPDLEIDPELSKFSQTVADKKVWEHSDFEGGENLAFDWNPNLEQAIVGAVRSFYNENQYYDWDNPGQTLNPEKEIGHFTQVASKLGQNRQILV